MNQKKRTRTKRIKEGALKDAAAETAEARTPTSVPASAEVRGSDSGGVEDQAGAEACKEEG
jgi:hypothetical protein